MGARLGHLAVAVVLLFGGCGNRLHAPAEQTPEPATATTTAQPSTEAAISEPTPSTPPYVETGGEVRQLAEAFVDAALAYDATTEVDDAFLDRVAPFTTPAELDRLRRSPRARLDLRVLRNRSERVSIAVTGSSTTADGRVVVSVERTTATSFATVRDLVEVKLELVADGGLLKINQATGGGL